MFENLFATTPHPVPLVQWHPIKFLHNQYLLCRCLLKIWRYPHHHRNLERTCSVAHLHCLGCSSPCARGTRTVSQESATYLSIQCIHRSSEGRTCGVLSSQPESKHLRIVVCESYQSKTLRNTQSSLLQPSIDQQSSRLPRPEPLAEEGVSVGVAVVLMFGSLLSLSACASRHALS